MSQITTIGDRVKLRDSNLVGIVRFIGEIKKKADIYYGIELDEAKGKNDGSISRIHYFRCASKHGLFIQQSQILKTNSKYNQDVPRATVGDTVYIKKFNCNAVVRYIGSPEFRSKATKMSRSKSITAYSKEQITSASRSKALSKCPDVTCTSPSSKRSKFAEFALCNIWYGVELPFAKGKNNGTVQKKWYFECDAKHGSFVRKEQIELIENEVEHDEEEKELETTSTPKGTDRPNSARNRLMNAWNWNRNNKENIDNNVVDIHVPHGTNARLKRPHMRERSRSLDLYNISTAIATTNDKKKKKKKVTITPQSHKRSRAHTTAKSRKQRPKSARRKDSTTKSKKRNKVTRSKSVTQRSDLKPNKTAKKKDKKKKKKSKKKQKNATNNGEEKEEEEGGRIEIIVTGPDAAAEDEDDDEKYVTIHDYNHRAAEMDKAEAEKVTTVGDRVKLSGEDALLGTVRFVGSVRNKDGTFYGIDLDRADKGKNDGSFRKKRYFFTTNDCKSGLFIKKERILKTVQGTKRLLNRVSVDDVVYVKKFGCAGTIRFIGSTLFRAGVVWYGIELEEAKGKNNGCVGGEWYFECEDKHGTFVSNKSITIMTPNEADSQSQPQQPIFGESGRTSSMNSEFSFASSVDSNDAIDSNLMKDILMTENDLAGFCLIWMIGLFCVIILRATQHELIVDTRWISIFTIPITVCLFTWLFSYLITKYTNRTEAESMRVPIFYIPFLCKLLVAMVFFGRLMADMKQRYRENSDYSVLCTATLANVWFDCVLSMATSEILITTVQVSSIKNIDQYRLRQEKKSWLINVFLFVTRPILWVYNRLIVMFISFYCYYYLLFAVGPVTTYICPIADIRSLRDIGVSTLLLPFHNVLYLFEFEAWTQLHLDHYEDHTDAMFAVIQQVLVFTTASDLILDIWSLYWLWKERARAIKRERRESVPPQPEAAKLEVIKEAVTHTVAGFVDDGLSYCLEPPAAEAPSSQKLKKD